MVLPAILLKPKKEAGLRRRHPWLFSGAIQKVIAETNEPLSDGELVQVYNHQQKFLGKGHYASGSIAVRMLTFMDEKIDQQFWDKRIQNAYQLRKHLGFPSSQTEVFRLVHGEGDLLPGLIIDIYKDVAVIQAHSAGMAKALPAISRALQALQGLPLKAIYNKSASTLHGEAGGLQDGYLYGKTESGRVVLENGLKFHIDWVEGQKTGFFIDQRENRKLLQAFCKGKKVLNTFSYSGGFSVYALQAGAKLVHSVDSSAKAIELTDENVALNFGQSASHQSFVKDTLKFLQESEEKYDVIILDPPAYAKHRKDKHRAVQAYKRLNRKAMEVLQAGGILFTFSCSQQVDRQLFENTITAAAIESQRNMRLLYHLSQPADHPVSIFHPEGEYLKGVVLAVD
jgi:23S rRNA (cytosine1962-C5)-methyltransferase